MLYPYGYNYIAYEGFEVIPLISVLPDEHTHVEEQPIRRREYIQVGDDCILLKESMSAVKLISVIYHENY